MKKIIVLLMLALYSQGCIAAAAGYAGYAISSSNKESAEKAAEAKNIQTYNAYKMDMEKMNLDRQKMGTKPQPIMTYSEWKLANNIPTRAPEPLKVASGD